MTRAPVDAAARPGPALRRLVAPVLVPTTLIWAAQGAAMPAVVLAARRLGAGPGQAALVVAAAGLGQLLGAAPAGALAARVGDRRLLLGSSVLIAACWAAAGVAPTVLALGAAVLVVGLASAAFDVARQTLVVDTVAPAVRARVMSTLGGVGRAGLFVGPLLGAAALARGGLIGAYLTAGVLAAAAALPLLAERRHRPLAHPRAAPPSSGASLATVARANRRTLLTWGSGAALIAAARSVRPALLPLWAIQSGLSPSATSLVFALAGGAELALFYPAGSVMDRRGRAWVAVPCGVVMAAGLLLLPLSAAPAALVVAALLLGVGSGLGSGIVKTLGADHSPASDRAAFLGLWALLAETGSSGGPLLIAALAAASLAVASLAAGALTLAGAAWLAVLFRRVARERIAPAPPR
jgi:MFS family permease